VIEKNEQLATDINFDASAYAPNRLAKNDVKNSSRFSGKLIPFCFAAGLHGLFFYWLNMELESSRKFLPDEVITLLDFSEPKPVPKPVDLMQDMQIAKPANTGPSAIPVKKLPASLDTAMINPVSERRNTAQALTLYDDTGRIRLPVDFVEKFDQANLASKRFDFQNPDLELAGTWLKRPPAIDFNPTQFEDAWKPDQDVLTELLEKAVEKTTKEIRIPVPGNPTVKLVCQVSVLALGGGCGFVPNGGYGRVIPDDEDDPKTLSPEEDRQCQAWWEKITNTRSQREWMKTKDLYELTCKKPLAKEKVKTP
jgi:hypothetical protein